jgi:hypothetical protein
MPKKEKDPKLHINLLHPQGLPESIIVRFVRWLIAYGRYIVVVVEIVVLLAFLARFKLDSDLNKVKQDVATQIPVIQSLGGDESIINYTQLQFETIGSVYNSTPSWKLVLDKISSLLPTSVQISNINLDNSAGKLSIKLLGRTSSHTDIAILLNGLKKVDNKSGAVNFKDVALVSVNFDQGDIVFTISFSLT